MAIELTLAVIRSQLATKQKLVVNEDTLIEIKKLSENPDYGPEFLECYLDHLNILKQNIKKSHRQYLDAVKFFSLVEAGNTLTDAYIKTFPHRWESRKANTQKYKKEIISSSASRYNNTLLINEIRKVAAIPVQLIHRHLLHAAILVQAHLMQNAKSELVRQKAAETLIRELKPSEDQIINVHVEDGAQSVIEELRKATERLAIAERQSVMAGVPLKQIAASKIIDVSVEEIDD